MLAIIVNDVSAIYPVGIISGVEDMSIGRVGACASTLTDSIMGVGTGADTGMIVDDCDSDKRCATSPTLVTAGMSAAPTIYFLDAYWSPSAFKRVEKSVYSLSGTTSIL